MRNLEIKPDVYWVGAVDWDLREFHGYSTPQGTTYNAYLTKDRKTALFDTVKKPLCSEHLARIRSVTDIEKIDYIIVNHVEMDHTGSLPDLVDAVKPEKIICSSQGQKALLAHFHREDWPYHVVDTGDTISLGSKSVHFIETRMLHWPDSMFSYIPEDKLLISQDAFGQHWATSERFDDEVDTSELLHESAKYYANIILPYSKLVQKLLEEIKQLGLDIEMIAPDHGLIWRSNVPAILESYDTWSRQIAKRKALVIYETMWHSTQAMARAVANGLADQGVSVQLMNLDVTHRSDIVTELLEAKAIVLGSATLNNGMLPKMAALLCYVKGLRPEGKIGAAFGSYGWGGEAVKLLTTAMREMGIEVVEDGLKARYVPTNEELRRCAELGRRIGSMVNERE